MFMVEKRNYVADQEQHPKQKDLDQIESRVDKDRKDKRRKNAQDREDAFRLEKQLKNDAKKLKQQKLVIFKGRPDTKRARKRDLKPKEKNDDRPSEDIID